MNKLKLQTIDDYGDKFSLEDFAWHRRHGIIMPYDGDGYFANEEGYSEKHSCFGDMPIWATQVVWYNK